MESAGSAEAPYGCSLSCRLTLVLYAAGHVHSYERSNPVRHLPGHLVPILMIVLCVAAAFVVKHLKNTMLMRECASAQQMYLLLGMYCPLIPTSLEVCT